MASIIDVSQAVVERLTPILPGWNSGWYENAPLPPLPAYVVRPDPAKYVDYQTSFGKRARWCLRIGFFASGADQEAARLTMGWVTDPKGPVIKALTSDDIQDDALWGIARMDVTVTNGRGWDIVRRNRVRGGYLYADIGVEIGSN